MSMDRTTQNEVMSKGIFLWNATKKSHTTKCLTLRCAARKPCNVLLPHIKIWVFAGYNGHRDVPLVSEISPNRSDFQVQKTSKLLLTNLSKLGSGFPWTQRLRKQNVRMDTAHKRTDGLTDDSKCGRNISKFATACLTHILLRPRCHQWKSRIFPESVQFYRFRSCWHRQPGSPSVSPKGPSGLSC